MTPQKKETIQYCTAIGFLITGIVMCFMSFFMNEYDIANGPLFYLGTATTFCGAVFGINLMVQNQVMRAETRINHRVDQRIEAEERKRDNLHKAEEEQEYLDPIDQKDL